MKLPPIEGLPYLVVTFTPDGLKNDSRQLQPPRGTMASERVIRRRSERQSEPSEGIDKSNVA